VFTEILDLLTKKDHRHFVSGKSKFFLKIGQQNSKKIAFQGNFQNISEISVKIN